MYRYREGYIDIDIEIEIDIDICMSWIHAASGNTRRRRTRICAACRGGLAASLDSLWLRSQ